MELKKYFVSTQQNETVDLMNDLLFGTYVSFLYKSFINNYKINIPSIEVMRYLRSLKVKYNTFLNNPLIKNSLNDFQIQTFKSLLNVLENNLNSNLSSFVKYDIHKLVYFYEEYSKDEKFIKNTIDFILSFCNIYNLNSFDGVVCLPKFIFDKDVIMITKFYKKSNISIDNSHIRNNEMIRNSPIDKIIRFYFLSFVEKILDKCDSLNEIIKFGSSLFVEYSHVSNFRHFLFTEICRKIENNNFKFDVLQRFNTSTIHPFVFKKRIIELILQKKIPLNMNSVKLLNLSVDDMSRLTNKLNLMENVNTLNYSMNRHQIYDRALEAMDEEEPDEEPTEEPDEEPTEEPTEEPDEGSENKIKPKDKKVVFRFQLASEDETLEDILYKLKIYKILFEYINDEDNKLSFSKKTILKNWLTKWIFLLSAKETRNLIKEFKLKI